MSSELPASSNEKKPGENLSRKIIFGALLLTGAVALAINGFLIPVLLGLISLNLVVLIHETGHYIAARKTGVEVLVFSIGMGPRLFGIRHKGIDYRISLFPIGGYVRMKGESLFDEALQKNDRSILEEPGSLFNVTPFKRIIIAVAGAGFNLISAVLFFFIAYLIGFTNPTNQAVAPTTMFYPEMQSRAIESGLLPGDIILEADGIELKSFTDLSTHISKSENSLPVTVLRNEEKIELELKLFKEDDKVRAGIISILKNEITYVKRGSAAWNSGIRKGDKVLSVNEKPTDYFLWNLMYENYSEESPSINLEILRNDEIINTELNLSGLVNLEEKSFKYPFKVRFYRKPAGQEGFLKASWNGITLPARWIWENFSGMAKVAKNPDMKLTDSVAGPINIVVGIGQEIQAAFKEGAKDGLGNFLNLTAIISSIIAIMNLLPIPALDGGMVVFMIAEWIRKKPFSPKVFLRYQLIGFTVIMGLAILILYVDISKFFK